MRFKNILMLSAYQSGAPWTLDLNFAASDTLDPRVTFTRASSATRFNSVGTLVLMTTDQPRFDYNPNTLAARGLLIEEARTNLFLNATIDGANLATQNVAVSAIAYTISFYGTGTITLSGAHVATINGSGAFPTRTTLTFTPSAGTLTCTVTGTVQYANIEAGSYATSFIPTAGATVTRAVEVAKLTGTNFSDWYNPSEGTFVVETATAIAQDVNRRSFTVGITGNNSFQYASTFVYDNAVFRIADTATSTLKQAVAVKANDFAISQGGAAPVTGTGAFDAGYNVLLLGEYGGALLNGHVKRITYYSSRKANAELQALST